MKFRFWGVRGSIPSGGKDTARVGGNTTCLEVRCGDELIIIDSGTGIRYLGNQLLKEMPVKATILYSHVHWDHIQGFPFFAPFYVKGNEFDIYGGNTLPTPIEEILNNQMAPPCFPVRTNIMAAQINYHNIRPGEKIKGKNHTITLTDLYHPQGSYGYRIECHNGCSLVFATDCEHHEDKLDENLLNLSKNVDALIYDAQYTEDEYYGLNGQFSRKGWGHSTMREGVKIAKEANVEKLILFHHDPSHNDEFIKKIESDALKLFPKVIAAYEGLEVNLKEPELPKSLFD